MSRNLRGLSARKGLNESLFREISVAASSAGGDRDQLLKDLSARHLIGRSSVLSASSFYDFLDENHQGKKAYVCNGTACIASGKHSRTHDALLKIYSREQIGTVTCLGYCHSGDAYLEGNQVESVKDMSRNRKSSDRELDLLENFNTGTNVHKPVFMPEISDLEEYYGVLNIYRNNISRALEEIELSALRGRGGAGFPLHTKLKTSAGIPSGQKYIVCNADEGDPGAFSDKWLLENRPHSILFGMVVSGLIIGADTGILYVRGEYPEAIRSIKAAVEEFKKLNLAFMYPDSVSRGFEFRLFEGQGAYICGEETSLLNSLEGLRPEVRSRPPFPATYGLFGKPTILCNVETFANLWYILKWGGRSFASLGTERSSGSKLVSLDCSFNKPGLYEIEMGTPMDDVIMKFGGGTRYPVKAYQIGGPLGGIVPSGRINDLTLDYESFNNAGFLLGHAGIVCIPEDFPVMKLLLHLFEFTARESCGKCFPCRIGSSRGVEMIMAATEGKRRIDADLFNDLLETMQLGSLCALGGGISLPVRNAMKYFSNEMEEYFLDDDHR